MHHSPSYNEKEREKKKALQQMMTQVLADLIVFILQLDVAASLLDLETINNLHLFILANKSSLQATLDLTSWQVC